MALNDDGVLSGVQTAIKRLQHVLGVAINGVLGVQTLSALAWGHPTALLQRYVVERTIRLARQVQHDPEHKLIEICSRSNNARNICIHLRRKADENLAVSLTNI